MSTEFDQKFDEWHTWAFEHKDDGGDIHQQIKFLKKALEGTLELLAHAAHDIRALEGRPKESLGQPLYLPGHLRVLGDLRRFG